MEKAQRLTYTVPAFAERLGISRTFAYAEARKGSIAGVPVLIVGRRMLVVRSIADRVLAGEPVEGAK